MRPLVPPHFLRKLRRAGLLAIPSIALLLMSGCEDLTPEPTKPGVKATVYSGLTGPVDGENPFSVANMRQAYANLVNKRAGNPVTGPENGTGSSGAGPITNRPLPCLDCTPMPIPEPEPTPCWDCFPTDPKPCLDCFPTDPTPIEATHLYVRFKPANTDQLADLDDLG